MSEAEKPKGEFLLENSTDIFDLVLNHLVDVDTLILTVLFIIV